MKFFTTAAGLTVVIITILLSINKAYSFIVNHGNDFKVRRIHHKASPKTKSSSILFSQRKSDDGDGKSNNFYRQRIRDLNMTKILRADRDDLRPFAEYLIAISPKISPSCIGYKKETSNTYAPFAMFDDFEQIYEENVSISSNEKKVNANNNDMNNDGKFICFKKNDFSKEMIHPDRIFSQLTMPPLTYVRNVLTYGDDNHVNHAAVGNAKETVIFCGTEIGGRLFQDEKEGDSVVQFLSDLLDGMPIACVYTGSFSPSSSSAEKKDSFDHETVNKNKYDSVGSTYNNDKFDRDHFERFFVDEEEDTVNSQLGNVENNNIQEITSENTRLAPEDMDMLRMVLSERSMIDTPFKQTIRRLLDSAVASLRRDDISDAKIKEEKKYFNPSHLVLLCYSTASGEVAAALEEWLIDAQESNFPQAANELRNAVTVVTLGATSKRFPRGPVYIHVSMRDDSVNAALGISSQTHSRSKTDNESNNDDIVFLHGYSPYYYYKTFLEYSNRQGWERQQHTVQFFRQNDAHNIRACLAQWLSITMRVNGARSFRFLHQLIAEEELELPVELEDELLPATICATKGYKWLWSHYYHNDASKGKKHEIGNNEKFFIMDEDEAKGVLEWWYGYDAYEEIMVNTKIK